MLTGEKEMLYQELHDVKKSLEIQKTTINHLQKTHD
jgi:hypothetical protein